MLNKNTWLKMLFGLVLLIFILSWIFLFPKKSAKEDYWIINPETVQRTMQVQKDVYQKNMHELAAKNSQLEKELSGTRQLLHVAKKRSGAREAVIQKLLSKKDSASSIGCSEDASCDSIKKEVVQYISEVHIKDSLYERQSGAMDSVLRVKDSIIVLQDQSLAKLDQSLQLISTQASFLIIENKTLRKQERKRRFTSTIKTIGIAVAVGLVVNSINNR